mgnify:CR=1 FL=1
MRVLSKLVSYLLFPAVPIRIDVHCLDQHGYHPLRHVAPDHHIPRVSQSPGAVPHSREVYSVPARHGVW